MTDAATLPARTRLPTIDAAAALLQSTLIEALNRRRTGEYMLEARLVDDWRGAEGAWIALEAGAAGTVHIAPVLVDGAVPSLTDAAGRLDAAAAAVALGAIEPLVAALELTIGQALRPVAVVAAAPHDAVMVELEARGLGAATHRVLVALDRHARVEPAASLEVHPTALVHVAPAWIGRIAGPSVAARRLQSIAKGDLLLLGTSGNVARFTPPGRTTMLIGRLDVQQGGITVTDETDTAVSITHDAVVGATRPADEQIDPPSAPAGRVGDFAPAELEVATSVEFDGGGLTMERLATLGVGSVVAIPSARGGVLPVRLLAAGTPVATGELVAVGEGYGVLITARAERQTGEG